MRLPNLYVCMTIRNPRPGLTMLDRYYSRYDMQKRYAVFYMIGSLASACSGILAYGIQQMVSKRSIIKSNSS